MVEIGRETYIVNPLSQEILQRKFTYHSLDQRQKTSSDKIQQLLVYVSWKTNNRFALRLGTLYTSTIQPGRQGMSPCPMMSREKSSVTYIFFYVAISREENIKSFFPMWYVQLESTTHSFFDVWACNTWEVPKLKVMHDWLTSLSYSFHISVKLLHLLFQIRSFLPTHSLIMSHLSIVVTSLLLSIILRGWQLLSIQFSFWLKHSCSMPKMLVCHLSL